MQRKDLIEMCTARGLPTYGTQAQVAARLDKADQTAPQPEQETPVVDIVAAPDEGNAALLAVVAGPPPAAPPTRSVPDPAAEQARIFAQMQAELDALRKQVAAAEANGGTPPAGPGEPATPDAIARAATGERVYRAEFPMLDG